MRKIFRSKRSSSHKQNNSTKSYVTGYLLSLALTIIPYQMVTSKSYSSYSLLLFILGFAVLQMMVQVIFFLHIGRGPKPLYNIVFFVSTVGIIFVVVGGSLLIMNNLHYNMSGSEVTKKLSQDESISQIGYQKTGACSKVLANHKIDISNGSFIPAHTNAKLCDTLTFINLDSKTREITFGLHSDHQNYGGQQAFTVIKGRGKTITLNQLGNFKFHDHLETSFVGDFSVTD